MNRSLFRHFGTCASNLLQFNGKKFLPSQLHENGVSQKCIDYIRQNPTCSSYLTKEVACAVEQHLHGNKVFIVDASKAPATRDTLINTFSIHPNDDEKLTYGALAAMPVCMIFDNAFLVGPITTIFMLPMVIGCAALDLKTILAPSEKKRYIEDVYDKFIHKD